MTQESARKREDSKDIILARYNEPFSIPTPKFQKELVESKDSNTIDLRSRNTNVFNIKIQGHNGFPVDVIENREIKHVISTTLTGFIVFFPMYELILNPYQLQEVGQKDRKFFLPFGELHQNISYHNTEEGQLGIAIDKPPVSIRITLNGLWGATEGKDSTRVFLIQGDQVIEGIPRPYNKFNDGGEKEDFIIARTNWGSMKGLMPTLGRDLLLPSDPSFFETMKILIGDKPPEIPKAS